MQTPIRDRPDPNLTAFILGDRLRFDQSWNLRGDRFDPRLLKLIGKRRQKLVNLRRVIIAIGGLRLDWIGLSDHIQNLRDSFFAL